MDVTHADIGIPTFQNKEVKLTDGSVKHFGRILKKNNLECMHTRKGVVYKVEKF